MGSGTPNGTNESFLVLMGQMSRQKGLQTFKICVKVTETLLCGSYVFFLHDWRGILRDRQCAVVVFRLLHRDSVPTIIRLRLKRLSSRKGGRRTWRETYLSRRSNIVHHTVGTTIRTSMTEFFYCHVLHENGLKKKHETVSCFSEMNSVSCRRFSLIDASY